MSMSGAQQNNDSNNTTAALPTKTRTEEPAADETMKKIFTVICLFIFYL
jgi:hypothetical protein